MYVGNICVRMSFEWEEKLKETYNSPLGKTTWERCHSKQITNWNYSVFMNAACREP